MFTRTVFVQSLVAVFLSSAWMWGQQKTPPPSVSSTQEFPVNLQQKVVAGITPVGAKVEAKLVVATLVEGKVLPRNTVFSGQVTESVAKSVTGPSRLAIRMDSAQWKNGSAPIKVYLTAWTYPERNLMRQDLTYGDPKPLESWKTWNGAGTYPVANSPISQPFPGRDMGVSPVVPDAPATTVSKQRVFMKDVGSERKVDGSVTIVSQRSNLKLDKLTTYVLANGDLLPTRK